MFSGMETSKIEDREVSFIIPTYNEEVHLPKVLRSIRDHAVDLNFETIVVDNGSTDSTVEIAGQYGVKILKDSSETIAGLRNLGAGHSLGRVLVFLDGDVLITAEWAAEFGKVLSTLDSNKKLITGSRCGISSDSNWIEKCWYLPMIHEPASYMNSGHLIIRRDLFFELGGFNENLITGEDWELSKRAQKKGITILNNPHLRVIHEGYPKTLREFVRRERWHGLQDFRDIKSFITSKVALITVLYWIIGIAGIALSIYFRSIFYIIMGLIINSILCIVATLRKQRQFPLNIFVYFLLYHVYFFSRGLSVGNRLFRSKSGRNR